MKPKTILTAILCTFLLLMLPNVNAVEYKEVKKQSDIIINKIVNVESDNWAVYWLIFLLLIIIALLSLIPHIMVLIIMESLGLNWFPGYIITFLIANIGFYIFDYLFPPIYWPTLK
jgi:hypothetical protein